MAASSRSFLKALLIVAVVGVAAWKAWSWNSTRTQRASVRDKVRAATAAIEAWRACLAGPHGDDVLTGIIAHRAAAPSRRDADAARCERERSTTREAVAALGPASRAALATSGPGADWLAPCAELRAIIGVVTTPAIKSRVVIPSSPGCELGGRELAALTRPPERDDATTRDVVSSGPDLVVSANARSRGANWVVRAGAAKDWGLHGPRQWSDEVALPPAVFELDWSRSGLVAVTWPEKQAAQIQRWASGRWSAGATFTPEGISWVRATGPNAIAVLGFERGREQVATLRRSTDGGTTLSGPIALIDGGDRDVRVRMSRAGAAVVMAATRNGEPSFEARRLGPTEATPAVTATLRWPGRYDGFAGMSVCTAADTLWALAQQRYLVVSTDGGAGWKEVADVGAALEFPRLACTPTALAIYSRTGPVAEGRRCEGADCEAPAPAPGAPGRYVRRCDGSGCATPVALPTVDEYAKVALVAPADLVVWLAPHGLPTGNNDQPQVLRRLRIEPGKLVDDGAWVVRPVIDAMDILVLEDEFVVFGRVHGTLPY